MKIAGYRFEGRRALSGLAAVTMTVLLAGCALPPPRELPPPRAAPLAPLAAPRPLVALALGGGGARGFAHIGVIKVLEGSGIVPDIVVGSSSGAIVAALYAGGMSGVELERTAVMLERDDLIDVVFEGRFMVRGALLQEFVNRTLGYRAIEELARPFALVATERGSGAMTVFNRGDTGLAVRASVAVPDLFLPVAIAG
ncbi:MAG: patatin-like phospholipase family protein, partial [Betaproteobacteria bacterium]|nr:patatin-like phospholipase family protein [Betaproteobacteria bacterium]